MEILVFGMLAVLKIWGPERKMIPETKAFHLDIQALKQVHNGRPAFTF